MGLGGGNGGDQLSSGMSTNPFFASGWDPVAISLSQHESFGGSSMDSQSEFSHHHHQSFPMLMDGNGGNPNSHHLAHYPSESSYVEMVPKFSSFGSGNFSEMVVGPYGLTECGQIANQGCHPNFGSGKEAENERALRNGSQSQEDHPMSDGVGNSPNNVNRRKRIAESNSPFDSNKNADGDLLKDPSGEDSDGPKGREDKKPKQEQNAGSNSKGKQAAKQAKEESNSGGDGKDSYIHVRARRGQATNSHSLAERVRREKISERMRLLQELVPGCNKITGKAVMLDEIINYVQSLQQQVEFLSMKLATVNPELNIDIERILSKDLLNSRGNNSSSLGFNPLTSGAHYPPGAFPPGMPVMPNMNPQFASMPQPGLDNELQSLLHMGFEPASAIDSLGPTARLKPEM
ncbi:unnamed protein product [Linum tenue]|uniref:BHLH domain-containing protein n=2 Tax=Linum tenue TaxID=586396 RepID=A0AAV0P1W1_9ROSI|nr:unnamed protein product [Linum tenue]